MLEAVLSIYLAHNTSYMGFVPEVHSMNLVQHQGHGDVDALAPHFEPSRTLLRIASLPRTYGLGSLDFLNAAKTNIFPASVAWGISRKVSCLSDSKDGYDGWKSRQVP